VNALAPIQTDEFEVVQRTARMLAISAYFDAKGDSPQAIAQVATKILAGRELGFGPFAAVQGIHIISGKPAVGANLMAAAVKGSGRYDYRVRKMADDEVVIEFFAVAAGKRESLGESSFTLKDAQAAAVTNNPTWKKFPRNMLFARAMSNGVRWYCPDVFSGNAVYVPEELGATVDDNGDVIETTGHVVMESRTNGAQPAHESAPLTDDVDRGMGDNPFVDAQPEPPAKLSAKTLKRLHALGSEVYGEAWDDKRPALVQHVTKGAATSSSDLTETEAATLIDGMNRKRAIAA
jgi:hypothetical protein